MRVIAQNVLEAKLRIDNELHSSIGHGFVLLVGFTFSDDEAVAKKIAEKIVKSRVFQDENGLTNLSINDIDGEILSVSQFTLYGDMKKGNRPSFVKALTPSRAQELYEYFNKQLEALLPHKIQTGIFGADMKVELINDGPFTMIYDSEELIK